MTSVAGFPGHAAAAAFDSLAASYDKSFTRSPIGRAQRNAVWESLRRIFKPGSRILELNCGTGEDALFLSSLGVSVVACDASPGMIGAARRRQALHSDPSNISFRVLPTERIADLKEIATFEGVLSNFSGLNCVADLHSVALDLAQLTKPNAALIICLSARFCLWEMTWFALRVELTKAFRRTRGYSIARLGGHDLPVWYPTIRHVRRSFAPWFRLRSIRAVGLTVPPTYLRARLLSLPPLLSRLERFDAVLGRWPIFRILGDHVLLQFEKVFA